MKYLITAALWATAGAIALAILNVAARAVFPLPDRDRIVASERIALRDDTRWGQYLGAASRAHPGKSGVLPLATGHSALAARLLLAGRAETSIDVQYYIWHDDVSGRILLRALYEAAQRGVRVRLLLDDNGVPGLDDVLTALNAQENFDIRIFNPSRVRSPKILGFAIDPLRMNRRMHNKSFIVDGAAAILGGRNIGDEYFEIGDTTHFIDLDVLAAGAIVPDTAGDFDRYWNSESSYPVDMVTRSEASSLPAWLDGAPDHAGWLADLPALQEQIELAVRDASPRLEWTDVRLVSDDPSKGLGKARDDQLMIHQMGAAVGTIETSLDLISPYFIPGSPGLDYFGNVALGGADVRILTNSLRATDVAIVHAGYSKYRRRLLEAGIRLFELKPQPGVPDGSRELTGLGSSGSSLHAKTLAIDGTRVFIGSFNFDPRSVNLNCEMGFLIDSPRMAEQMRAAFVDQIARGSYEVVLRDGQMLWLERGADGTEIVHGAEPDTSMVSRLMVTLLGVLPIEWAL